MEEEKKIFFAFLIKKKNVMLSMDLIFSKQTIK
jgi:hypothetical protein